MVTKANLESDLKQSMRESQKLRTSTLRMALSAIKLVEVDKQRDLDEAEITSVLQREAKARRETIEDAQKANRPDIIKVAEDELEILAAYLPAPLSEAELESLVRAAIAETGASGMQDMGKLMSAVMSQVGARAEGKVVSQMARKMLAED
jgi:uncharacterized protein YqeY